MQTNANGGTRSRITRRCLAAGVLAAIAFCVQPFGDAHTSSRPLAQRAPDAVPIVELKSPTILASSIGPIVKISSGFDRAGRVLLTTADGRVHLFSPSKGEVETVTGTTSAAAAEFTPDGFAVLDRLGADCRTDRTVRSSSIRLFGSTGQRANARALGARSFAVLPDSRYVLASPTDRALVHLVGRTGHVLAQLGDPLRFELDAKKNRFLNEGLVATSADSSFYFASRYSPVPILIRYSADTGEELARASIDGPAIDATSELAERVTTPVDRFVGVVAVNALAVNPHSGHVFVGLNGTSMTPVLYEFNPSLQKVREFVLQLPDGEAQATNVQSLSVNQESLLTVIDGRLIAYSLRNAVALRMVRGIRRQQSCPPEVAKQSCSQSCGVGGGSIDCRAELDSRLRDNDRTTSWSCSINTPYKCDASVNYCNTVTFVTGSLSVHQECAPNRTDKDDDGYTPVHGHRQTSS